MKKIITASVVALLSSGAVFAENPTFDFVEAGYVDFDQLDGFSIRANASISDNFFVNLGHEDISGSEAGVKEELDSTVVGLGIMGPISDVTSIFMHMDYVAFDTDNTSQNGWGLGAGIRSNVAENIELYGEVFYKDLDANHENVELTGGVRFKASEQLGAYVEWTRLDQDDDDSDGFRVGVQYKF